MRKKVNLNPELLKEEAKRFKLLTEYSFYHEESVMSPSATPEKPVILGGELEEAEDEEPKAGEEQEELGFDQAADMEDQTPPTPEDNQEMPAEPEGEEGNDIDFGAPAPEDNEEMPSPEEEMPFEEPAPEDDDIEIDVTSLVDGTEDAKKAAIKAMKVSKNSSKELMDKLSDLEARISRMDSVASKIENLEKEIVKRNPTPVEKLEMRSLSSYPYNIKLSDYWSDKEGSYDVMDKKEKEYVLTKDDIDSNYSYSQIKDTFDKPLEDQGYEEEDI